MCHVFIIPFSVKGHLGCFQVVAIMNQVPMIIFTLIFNILYSMLHNYMCYNIAISYILCI